MKKRRDTEVFGLSFLDCICCGFGAILLLYILLLGKPETVQSDDIAQIAQLRSELAQLAEEQARLEELLAQLASNPPLDINAQQSKRASLLEELARQEKALADRRQAAENQASEQAIFSQIASAQKTPFGLREDLTHVAFVIDTSGSMRDPLTRTIRRSALQKIEGILSSYPAITSIQFLDTSGQYILSGTARQWLPDTTQLRDQALRTLYQYRSYSVSNPFPGIEQAIRDLSSKTTAPDQRMGIILFGDEFNHIAEATLTKLDKLNPWRTKDVERLVSINAFGFPNVLSFYKAQSSTAFRFASLMQRVTSEHSGTLILLKE